MFGIVVNLRKKVSLSLVKVFLIVINKYILNGIFCKDFLVVILITDNEYYDFKREIRCM